MTFTATDQLGGEWVFDVSGAFTNRFSGLRRADVLWKALGQGGGVARGAGDQRPMVLLTTDVPARSSAGAAALRRSSAPASPCSTSSLLHDVEAAGATAPRSRRRRPDIVELNPTTSACLPTARPSPNWRPRWACSAPIGRRRAARATERELDGVDDETWATLVDLERQPGLARRLPRRVHERPRLPDRARRARGQGAPTRRVDRWPPPTGRRGAARRPAHRPRVPGELQVPVEDPAQPQSGPARRRSAHAGAGGRSQRLVPASRAGRASGAVRDLPLRIGTGRSSAKGR